MKKMILMAATSALLLAGCGQGDQLDKSAVRSVVRLPAMVIGSISPNSKDDATQKMTDLFMDCMYHYKRNHKINMKGIPAYVDLMSNFLDSHSQAISKALDKGPRAFASLIKKSDLQKKFDTHKKARTGQQHFSTWVTNSIHTEYCTQKKKALNQALSGQG